MVKPLRGEIWMASLDPTKGYEIGGQRPVLIVSSDLFNKGRSTLVFVLPITRTNRNIPAHVAVEPPEGGLVATSYILCDALRSISKSRLGAQARGQVSAETMANVEARLRFLMQLD
jgi:mRNA interferase MazF